MSNLTLLVSALLYLSLLFWIAYRAEQRSRQGRSLVNNPYIYALSLAVYCTAWTFYGSVGRATSEGIQFLAVYVGPTITAPLWWIVLRKTIRICKAQRITSIADFVSARYGKNRTLGVLVTVLSVMGIIPYISIQLKAVSGSVAVLSGEAGGQTGLRHDQSLLITLFLAVFTILFGARKLEATERHEGLVTAIAFESLVKLVAFLSVGAFVTFGLFNGPGEIFERASQLPELRERFTQGPGYSSGDWFWYCLLSAVAVLFLPRQFQVAVVENVNEAHLNKAMWLFPLYLFLINLFVLPLAFGGKLLLAAGVNADTYVLSLPLMAGQKGLVLLAYIGGFSAATSMIIVEATALSVMISNNVVMPLLVSLPGLQRWFGPGSSVFVINTRRLAIMVLLLLAYFYYREVADYFSLVSVGMISFAAVAQFAPAIIGGIYWKRGAQFGAITGLVAGMLIWFYTLIVPTLVPVGFLPASLMTEGPFGIWALRPQALFGLDSLSPISHAVFWSLFINTALYVWGSLHRAQSSLDHNQAVLFVDVFRYRSAVESSVVWKGKALVTDLRALLARFFGDDRSNRLIERYVRRNGLNVVQPYADPRLVTYTEKLLAGAIGTASARILVASVAKEEPISVEEVIRILKNSQELLAVNKELKRKSAELEQLTQQLSEANERLKRADQQKDDFLSTVTHEIRTPITSVRALSEILHDTPDMDLATRQHFLETIIKESERLTRLINQVLDLERIESGRHKLVREPVSLPEIIQDSVEAVAQLAAEKHIRLHYRPTDQPLTVEADRDRMQQVLINLLSNAIKFSPAETGEIAVRTELRNGHCLVSVADNGQGIDPAYQKLIFEKFYQAHDKAVRKPKGSGLGLAISKKIIELHHGNLTVESRPGQGSTFTFELPVAE
ncbi:sensor histidine kinase [Tellurirhabdus rosea]|uniref:sensor histidine kinase n=1 Tax=Tellurirhabdus rosea TaxID=2674997 RepID=UPI00225AADD9|nr:sensor histidine kinase [Tellurirhabdus rosea]